jgi:glycosyltransferase involved in cell wall biosynthesis
MRIVMFGHNDWWVWSRQGFCTRNAALARELASRDEVGRLLVVDAPRWGARTHRPDEERGEPVSIVAPKVAAVRWNYLLPLPATWRPGRRLNERLGQAALLRRLSQALAPAAGPTVLWVADPRLVEAALAVPHDLFVFDAIDDWRQHPWAGPDMVRRGYELAGRHADVVFAVHPRLLQIVQPQGHGEVLYNAVDARLWAEATPEPTLAGGPRPLVGYAGMIQHRLDVPLLRDVARLLPQARFLLLGSVSPKFRAQVAELGDNVSLPGPRPHAEVPPAIAACDAGMVPHVRDALTASMDPLKLYEYLAAGKPVVSTVTSPNPALREEVQVARDPQAFAAALERAVGDDSTAARARRRQVVAGESWPRRTDRVLAVLEASLAGRTAG